MPDKPLNVIVITSDEMRADCLGFMGNAVCRTPSADSLAPKGVVFANHFTVHGKCVPSRIAMQTGRYCHTDGFRTINLHLPSDQPNLLGALKQQGYESAVFGHNHVWEDFWGEDNRKSSGYVDYHSYTKDYFWHLLDREWPVPQPGPDSVKPKDLSQHGFDYAGRIDEPLTGFCDDNRAEQAIHYLKEARDRTRPFYLHLNFGKPHPSYRIEEPYFSMYD
ncbi:MAG: sulfatase-like hydrolase/transferase, partial [Chitinivibrionales bacterium]|nr:sulfatase-like hydrolase/transferase [Chitinivibrionales bacterium]